MFLVDRQTLIVLSALFCVVCNFVLFAFDKEGKA